MQQMIVLASPDGVVDMTPQAIAARTSIPFDIIEKGLTFLAQPDPYTRTPGEEGRRIVLIDDHRPWGWRLVNHGKYMRLRNMVQKREYDRARIAEKRSQNKSVAIVSQAVANVAHSDSDSDSDSDLKKEEKKERSQGSRLPSGWFPSETLKAWAEKERSDLNISTTIANFRDFWIAKPGKGATKLDWEATFRVWVRNEKPGKKSKEIDFEALASRIEEEDRKRAGV